MTLVWVLLGYLAPLAICPPASPGEGEGIRSADLRLIAPLVSSPEWKEKKGTVQRCKKNGAKFDWKWPIADNVPYSV
jgi:hypothetical protein